MKVLNRLRNIWNLGGNTMGMSSSIDFFETRGLACLPDITLNFDELDGFTTAYNRCSSLRAIINKNSSALVNGEWHIYNRKDKEVDDKYPGIKSLLTKPNPLQSWSEFLTLSDVYRQVYGEVFIYAVVPVGYNISDASALWAINPALIDVRITGKMYEQSDANDIIEGYYLNQGGESKKLDKDCILHIRDVSPNINFSSLEVRGESRLVGLKNVIKNIIQAEEAIYALNKDRGAQGMLINKSSDKAGHIPLTPSEKNEIQREYKLRYGVGVGQDKVLITNADLQWQQMSFNVKDLMLFEGIESNIQRLADALDYPYELISSGKGVTYANKLEAKRDYYQNNIIPLAKYYAEAFSNFFGLTKDSIYIDFSSVECLRKSEQERADELNRLNQAFQIAKNNGVISRTEWRIALGMPEEIYKPDNSDGNEKTNTGEENEE